MSLRFFEDFWAGLPAEAQRSIAERQRRAKGRTGRLTDLNVAALSVDYYEAELARTNSALAETTRQLAQASSEVIALRQTKASSDLVGAPVRKRAAQRGIGVFALIRNDLEELLLVRQADGRWTLPGGKLKASETILEGLAR